jgi:hypothetical protein
LNIFALMQAEIWNVALLKAREIETKPKGRVASYFGR